MKSESSLEELLPSVNRAVDIVLQRRRRNKVFAEDFRAWVMLKVLERDGARLKGFRGESTLLTYLRVVVDRLYCDYLISVNGKWRRSKKTAELGTKAVELERLVYHDGFTLDQAVAVMQSRDGRARESDLRALFAEIPNRHTRYFVGLESVAELRADPQFSADAILQENEMEETGHKIRHSLASALADLPEQDWQILELRFAQGLRISLISQLLGLKQRSVYGRVSRLLRLLKKKLEARGVGRSCVAAILQGSFSSQGIEGVLAKGWARRAPNETRDELRYEPCPIWLMHPVESHDWRKQRGRVSTVTQARV